MTGGGVVAGSSADHAHPRGRTPARGRRALVLQRLLPVALSALTAPLGAQEMPPLERHGHRAHVVNGRVYAFGGYGRGPRDRGTTRVFAWTPGESAWVARAEMPKGRSFFGSAVLDGNIYSVGSSIERYDPEEDAWSSVSDRPGLPRSHHGVALFRGRLHVIGGIPEDVSGHRVFDPVTEELSIAPPPPDFAKGDHLHVLAVLGERLHCVGGIGSGSAHAAFDGERWVRRAAPPAPLQAKFAVHAAIGGSLYVFLDSQGLRYDAADDTWHEVAALPARLAMPVAIVREGKIEVVGGRRLAGGGYGAGRYDPTADRWEGAPAAGPVEAEPADDP